MALRTILSWALLCSAPTLAASPAWAGYYTAVDSKPLSDTDSGDDLDLAITTWAPHQYWVLHAGYAIPMQEEGERLVAGDAQAPSGRSCPFSRSQCSPPIREVRRRDDGALIAGPRTYTRIPHFDVTQLPDQLALAHPQIPAVRAYVDRGIFYLRAFRGGKTCLVGILLPDSGHPPVKTPHWTAGGVALASWASDDDGCPEPPSRDQIRVVSINPVGALVMNAKGKPAALVILGYMFEAVLAVPHLTGKPLAEAARVGYQAVGAHAGESIE